MELLHLLIGTLFLRPYVFAFLLIYFIASCIKLGPARTITFTIVGYVLAWASEFASIHWGIPYGLYYYIEETKGRELWVFGVPFMDSISYVFLTYCSYSVALFVLSPVCIKGRRLVVREPEALRRSPAVTFLSAVFMMFLDIIIDPLALRGDRWFLGKIHGYSHEGIYFGIPLSNFIGWFLMGWILTYSLQRIDLYFETSIPRDRRRSESPIISLMGPFLYLCVLLFNLVITFWIGELLLGYVGILIFLQPLVLIFAFTLYKVRHHKGQQ